ncbi:conserved exported hypothetical protein [Candidatus Sulfopaludibacter sp. SbA4]|nr:conserved exported hypothetical protein [Candidatus Sulfopaludibacter sp. SbA4]
MTYSKRRIAAALGLFTLTAPVAFAQPARLEFEVASIKPAAPITNKEGKFRIGMRVDAGRMEYTFVSLRDCIRTAYRVKDYQVQGPDWLADVRFDIVAKLPEGASIDQVPEMLQTLLADRFKLALHHESKEHSVYALVVGKNGPKLAASDPDARIDFVEPKAAAEATARASGGLAGGGMRQAMVFASGGKPAAAGGMSITMGSNGAQMEAKKMTLAGLADMLSRFVDRPVVDMTEIQGTYDFSLEMASDQLMQMKGTVRAGGDAGGGPVESADGGPGATIFQSIQKYGLKLEPRKAPIDMLVVDRIEKTATEN